MKRAILAAVLFAAGGALAQTQPVKTLDFSKDPELIPGDIQHPSAESIDTRAPASFSQLIQIRKDFQDKIRTSQLP